MKASMLGLLIAAGAFGARTIYLAGPLRVVRAQAVAVTEQSRALQARIAELERIRAGLESARVVEAPAAELVQGGKPSDAPVRGETVALTSEVRQAEPAERAGPAFRGPPRSEAMQKMMRTQLRANFKRMNADIGAKLGLGAEDASKLVDLLVDQQMATMERVRESRGANQSGEQLAAVYADQQQKNLAEISALIGADKMEAYKAYQESAPARQEVDMLSRQLEANDLNLSKDQRDRMVTALAEERQRVPPPKGSEAVSREEFLKDMTAWQEYYNQRTALRASSILTSEQQATYAEYQQWTKEMRQQSEARRAARGGDGAGPRGAAPAKPTR
jgi:hypothetical protein